MHRRQRARYDYRTALVEGHAGPARPFGQRTGDHHAGRRGLDDPGADADMGAHPGIVWHSIGAAARDVIGEWRQRLRMLVAWPQRRVKIGKAAGPGVLLPPPASAAR